MNKLIWISKFAYKVDSIFKLIKIGALSKNEVLAFAEEQRFLLSVRCHLHYRAEREDDRLAMDAQLEIAKSMNFKNTILSPNSLVIVESTIEPGFIEDEMVSIITKSGRLNSENFFIGVCPENANPGEILHDFTNLPRLVGGINPEITKIIKLATKSR